jgi:hypothetical protein
MADESASPLRILFGRIFPAIGAAGLAITIAMNLVALLVFKKAAAEFWSPGWWSSWFACYAVWISFGVIGTAAVLMKRN